MQNKFAVLDTLTFYACTSFTGNASGKLKGPINYWTKRPKSIVHYYAVIKVLAASLYMTYVIRRIKVLLLCTSNFYRKMMKRLPNNSFTLLWNSLILYVQVEAQFSFIPPHVIHFYISLILLYINEKRFRKTRTICCSRFSNRSIGSLDRRVKLQYLSRRKWDIVVCKLFFRPASLPLFSRG